MYTVVNQSNHNIIQFISCTKAKMEPKAVHPACVVYATLCFLTILNEASVVAFQSTSSDLEGQDHIYPSTVAPGDTRTPLTLGLMLSFSGDYVTKDAIPGIQIAVDTINAGDILPGYILQYSLTNSQVSVTHLSCLTAAGCDRRARVKMNT